MATRTKQCRSQKNDAFLCTAFKRAFFSAEKLPVKTLLLLLNICLDTTKDACVIVFLFTGRKPTRMATRTKQCRSQKNDAFLQIAFEQAFFSAENLPVKTLLLLLNICMDTCKDACVFVFLFTGKKPTRMATRTKQCRSQKNDAFCLLRLSGHFFLRKNCR